MKIGNAYRRMVVKDPDGEPETARERRELVRQACVEIMGREPSDSLLSLIMDELEVPR